jgi:hypothetical protein
MKRDVLSVFGTLVAAAAVFGLITMSVSMAASTTLKTFGDGVTLTGPDSATIVLTAGQSGGVYINSKSQSSKPLSQIAFSFVSTGDVAGGAPRFSINIDTDGKAKTNDGYAFLDAAGCGGVSGGTTTVSTSLSSCHVNFQNVDYANWATFAATNPTYKTGQGYKPFIISDQPGSYAVSSIVLR